jgi:hypothetical protein
MAPPWAWKVSSSLVMLAAFCAFEEKTQLRHGIRTSWLFGFEAAMASESPSKLAPNGRSSALAPIATVATTPRVRRNMIAVLTVVSVVTKENMWFALYPVTEMSLSRGGRVVENDKE